MSKKILKLLIRLNIIVWTAVGLGLIFGPGLAATLFPCGGEITNNSGNVLTSPNGEPIIQVVVKAGANCFTATSDGLIHNGCYLVSGIGTDTVTVTRVGTPSPDCQEISHLEGNLGEVPPTDTPPPPTPTNTEIPPTPTPTDIPPTATPPCVDCDFTPTPPAPTVTPTNPPPTATPPCEDGRECTPTPTPPCEECDPKPTPTPTGIPPTPTDVPPSPTPELSPTPPKECNLIPQYEQWLLTDSSTVSGYLPCYIISQDPPSAERAATLCTTCGDQLSGEYTFEATSWRHGTVYLNECTGEYVYIFDDGARDENWYSVYFRPYLVDNTRTTPRCENCEVQATQEALNG